MTKEITEKLKSSTAIEINGITFHSFQEMLIYMDKLREENKIAKEIIYDFYDSCKGNGTTCVNTGTRFIDFLELVEKAESFLKGDS